MKLGKLVERKVHLTPAVKEDRSTELGVVKDHNHDELIHA